MRGPRYSSPLLRRAEIFPYYQKNEKTVSKRVITVAMGLNCTTSALVRGEPGGRPGLRGTPGSQRWPQPEKASTETVSRASSSVVRHRTRAESRN